MLLEPEPPHTCGVGTYGKVTVRSAPGCSVLTIGKYCSIADAKVMLDCDHRLDWVTTYPFSSLLGCGIEGHPATKGDVNIGNDVWIGDGATIMSGVTIGDGAVIGCKSVVTKDCDPYCVYAGNPARFKGPRFSAEQIESLLEIKWWDWPKEKIEEWLPLLLNTDIQAFIDKALA
jgi:acetyltransferase-like isoleucine patch superfamily enzyme